MNDDLNNRSSESITTVFPRLRVLLLLCAYCLPFSFFLFNYWGDFGAICLILFWIILLVFLTQKSQRYASYYLGTWHELDDVIYL